MTAEAPWLDKRNLEEWLQTRVKEVQSVDKHAAGEHYMSVMKQLQVTSESGKVYNLLVKSRLEEGATAEIMKETDLFKKEQHMYSTTLKSLHQLLRAALPDSFEDLAPKCYYACDQFMVLENLTDAGFSMADSRKGLDLEQSLLVIRSLARLHAASVVLHETDPGAYQKYEVQGWCEPNIKAPFSRFYAVLTNILAEEVESWTEEWHKYAVYLRSLAGDVQDMVDEQVKRCDADFNVLLHGDPWTNNIMLKNRAQEIRFVDYQLVNYSSPAIDLNYFFWSSVDVDTKIRHRDRLIQEYHNTLCDTLTALGYKKKVITLAELQQALDKKLRFALFTILFPMVLMQMPPGLGFSLEEGLRTGNTPGTRMYGNYYKETVKLLLPILESKGVFG